MTAAKRGASFENARSGAGMRTGRALERHLQEHIVAGHVATAPRAPFVPSGRALDAPTGGRSGRRAEDATGVISRRARWRFWSVANFRSASFRNFVPSPVLSPIARAPHKICHPLCCVVFPHTSRQTRATVRACGREKRRTPRTSSRRVRRRGCSPCIFARRWGHAVVAGKPAEPSTGERRSDSAFGLKG